MNSINRLFPIEEQISFLNRTKPDIHPEKLEQYRKILLENYEYPNVHSLEQFKTVIKSFIDGSLEHLVQLILLIQYTIKRRNSKDLLNIFIKGNYERNDKMFYSDISNFLFRERKSYKQKFISQPGFIYHKIVSNKLLKSKINVKRIMDIGCGNGFKASELGKLFNLKNGDIVCADIEKWFDYDDIERNKRNVELLQISESGPIKYKSKNIDLITMIHTIHHWDYKSVEEYVLRLSSLKDFLSENGLVVIFEHDVLTKYDACILDIEHGLWENVMKKSDKDYTRFYKEFNSKYLNFIEVEMLMDLSGFKSIYHKHYDAGSVTHHNIPNKSYLSLYVKK